MKFKNNLFWIGWTIWICMVVVKIFMVFGDYPDFCWDPMFLMVPFSFIILGGIQRCHCHKTHCEKCGCHKECDCDCHKKEE